MNYIYGYQNKKNKKWYVGQTTSNISTRDRSHVSGAMNAKASDYNCMFHRKIREYGRSNFDLVVLEEVENREDLDERERYWIKAKRSFIRDNGYNSTTGGQKRKGSENYVDIRSTFQTPEAVNQVISEIKNQNNKLTSLAEKYEVSLSLICSINTGKNYHSDKEEYPLRPLKNKVDQDTVQQIVALLKENYTNKEISDLLELSDDDIVYRINYGKAHKMSDEQYPIRKEDRGLIRANKIKDLLREGVLNNKQIATLVGCDPSVVSNINYGKNFKDSNLNYPIRQKNS